MLSLLLVTITQISVLYGQCDPSWHSSNYNEAAERVYYIGCVEVEWDYAPSGMNLVTGEMITSSSPEATWLIGNGVDRIGRKYLKALYREFTDCSFTTQKERTPDQEHLGALGPNIRALTGETIKIFYKNMCSIPTSMHAHGVRYDKMSEGAPYNDADGANPGDIVPPNGGQWIYIWHARANNIDSGTSSKMWLYHSHVDEPRDVNTGLIGAIIITQNGLQTSSTNLKPSDIDREFTTFFVLYNENESLLFNDNLIKYLGGIPPDTVISDPDFEESNLMHSINGYLFGNLDDLIMSEDEIVRWYTASFGNELDGPHSPHWHGNIAIDTLGDNTDTVVLIPGTTYTVTMTIDETGEWLYHCHVHDHIDAGMITTYHAETRRVIRPLAPPNLASFYCAILELCSNVIQRIQNPVSGFLFECDGPYICTNSIFEIELTTASNNNNNNEFQGILCKTSNACNGARFNIINNSNNGLDIVKIECSDIGSCDNMEINISSDCEITELICNNINQCENCIIRVSDQPSIPPISCHSLQGRSYPA